MKKKIKKIKLWLFCKKPPKRSSPLENIFFLTKDFTNPKSKKGKQVGKNIIIVLN